MHQHWAVRGGTSRYWDVKSSTGGDLRAFLAAWRLAQGSGVKRLESARDEWRDASAGVGPVAPTRVLPLRWRFDGVGERCRGVLIPHRAFILAFISSPQDAVRIYAALPTIPVHPGVQIGFLRPPHPTRRLVPGVPTPAASTSSSRTLCRDWNEPYVGKSANTIFASPGRTRDRTSVSVKARQSPLLSATPHNSFTGCSAAP